MTDAATQLIFRVNTPLFHNCLDGFDETSARKRPHEDANSALWLAGHLAHSRGSAMAWLFGADLPGDWQGMFGNGSPKTDESGYPSLDDIRSRWDENTAAMVDILENATEEQLARVLEHSGPLSEPTVRNWLSFLAQHESFHIGQLSYLRKVLGLPSMSYANVRG